MRRVIIWVTGRDLLAPKSRQVGGVRLTVTKGLIFEYAPTGDWFSLTLGISAGPNILHRVMQRLVIGVKYRMINKDDQ